MRIKRLFLSLAITLLAISASAQIGDLPRSTPEAEGVPSKALIELYDSLVYMPQTDIHSLIVMRHGKVIGEIYPKPFAPEYQHTQYSSSKTLVSLAVGLAVDENRLRINDRVATFFPEYLPDTISDNLAAMTVKDLLTMTSGVKPDWNMRNRYKNWVEVFLNKEVKNTPGEVFAYDSMVTYMLSAIIQRVTGKTVLDYLDEKLFSQMNIEKVAWEISPEGFNTGGWGLHIQSESLAKIGQLWLDGGVRNGKQLISKDWIDQMSSKQSNGGDYGYGFQTWQCAYPTAVRADGALGQYVIVVPEKDVVIVLTEASFTNGKPQRGLFWNKLLPQMVDEPLAESADYEILKKREQEYQLPTPQGKKSSSQLKKIIGKSYKIEKSPYEWSEVSFDESDGNLLITITKKDGEKYTQPLGYKEWLTTEIAGFPPYSLNPIGWKEGLEGPFYAAGSYAWDKKALVMKIHYVNWVTALEFRWEWNKDGATVTISNNYGRNSARTYNIE